MNDNYNVSSCKKQPNVRHYADSTASVMRKAVVFSELWFYKRSDVLSDNPDSRKTLLSFCRHDVYVL